jgi:hypothetical protein
MPSENVLDVDQMNLEELWNMNQFYKRQTDAETKAAKAKGGAGTNKLDESAREFSKKQLTVNREIDQRLMGIHQERNDYARKQDNSRKAQKASTPMQWANFPDRFDWPGIDTPKR